MEVVGNLQQMEVEGTFPWMDLQLQLYQFYQMVKSLKKNRRDIYKIMCDPTRCSDDLNSQWELREYHF